jgi:cyclopropane-fatty-acyl-phospholipid synthase
MLERTLNHLVKAGRLTIIQPNNCAVVVGQSESEQCMSVVVRLTRWMTPIKIALWPDLYLGEAYVDGTLIIEQGSLWDLLAICASNQPWQDRDRYLGRKLKSFLRYLRQRNAAVRARRNISHHYDVSRGLFEGFLDQDMQYSCAYFHKPDVSLEEAQRAKKQHIIAKLLLKPGQRILDIGCGWGGLALTLAESEDVNVLGVTLSTEQLRVARRRAHDRGLAHRVKFALRDYRQLDGKFDRIVSVGMFEHVGAPNYAQFFHILSRLLTADGIALIHSIGRKQGPDVTSAWIRKYIFPGGYVPALSQVCPAIEGSGLWLTDLEILRLHYAETLKLWRQRFLLNREQIQKLYDERFCRMWEFYLAWCEAGFRYGSLMVFQAQLAGQIHAVPLTRDYMLEFGSRFQAVAAE